MARFDFAKSLAKRTQSVNTHRAYFRWVDRFMVDLAGFLPSTGPVRARRMATLNVGTLERHLTDRKLLNWLQKLAEENQSRQALDQARAAIVTMAELFTDEGHMERPMLQGIQDIHVPSVERKTTPERLLSPQEMKTLGTAIVEVASSDSQRGRNAVITSLLWTLALRREELSALRWRDILLREGKPFVMIQEDALEIPRVALVTIDRWRSFFTQGSLQPSPDSPLLRRIWKGGRIAKEGLSPDGVWLIIHQAAIKCKLGAVTPDDLRRSVISQMRQEGATVRDINRLLRHRSMIITERFLAKLGLANDES